MILPSHSSDAEIVVAPRSLARLSRATRRLLDDAMLVVAAHRDLQRLARLDDRALRDIGITRFEAEWLARRSIWSRLRRRSETASLSTH